MFVKNEVIGRYLIERVLSFGGMSEIFEVYDLTLNVRWFMKATDIEDKRKIEAVKRETEILKSVSHPCVPRIVDSFEKDGFFFEIMDYIDGYNLKVTADAVGGIKEKDAIKIGIKLALALSYLHSKGIIYRDLKPSNVMISKDGYVRLVDFGIVAKKGSKSFDKSFYITREYAPEELLLGQIGDERSDIYELGATLTAVCIKKRSRAFKDFCRISMNKNPSKRFQSADEAVEFLRNIDNRNKRYRKDFLMASIWAALGILFFVSAVLLLNVW